MRLSLNAARTPAKMPRDGRPRLDGPAVSHRREPDSPSVKADVVLPHLADTTRTRVGGGYELPGWTDRLDHISQPTAGRRSPPKDAPEHQGKGGGVRLSPRSFVYHKPEMGLDARLEITVESLFEADLQRFKMPTEDIDLANLAVFRRPGCDRVSKYNISFCSPLARPCSL